MRHPFGHISTVRRKTGRWRDKCQIEMMLYASGATRAVTALDTLSGSRAMYISFVLP